jgi:hypothetical protein
MPINYATHAGEDVGVYASGPFSHLFTGNSEQHNIPVMMSYAAEIGRFASAATTCSTSVLLLFVGCLIESISNGNVF